MEQAYLTEINIRQVRHLKDLSHSIDGKELYKLYQEGRIILVYFPADRKYLLNKSKAVEDVEKWFEWLQGALRELFDNDQLILKFSLEEMCYKIKLSDREEFGLDEMASGYEALFDIFSEIVIRMEQQAHLKYDLPGIVLIDEIELHLHIAWQKRYFHF